MQKTMENLISLMVKRGLEVIDLRGKMRTHDSRTFARRDPEQIVGVAGHHSAGPGGEVERFHQIADYHVGPNHVSSRGCPGILYTMGITSQGKVGVFWDLDVATWSQADKSRPGDENRQFLSVLSVGNFDSPSNRSGEEPTPEQMWALSGVVLACRELWGPSFQITGHYDLGKPACPGATLETMLRAMATHVQLESAGRVTTLLHVQKALKALGYDPGKLDGLDGPKTRGAVCAFQQDHTLKVDGKAGPKTRAAIQGELERTVSGPGGIQEILG